ncbi:DsbC family protein [Advenella sp. RU8]|uniref:DsbC family protein n=1 Tax=Advenella sp. RU8 TaxID=3399575 RepID=UPI003AAB7357
MKLHLNKWARLKALSVCCMLGLACSPLMAQEATNTTDNIKAAIASAFEVDVTAVEKTPYEGIYEVQMGANIVYTTEKADFVIAGNLIDAKTKADVTSERVAKLSEVPFDTLPIEKAVKRVIGNGERKVAIFEDPNCGYCKKLYKEFEEVDNVTVYTFLMPILAPDSMVKAKNIWCAKDQAQAWGNWMGKNETPPAAECEETPISSLLALGRDLGVQGTPAMFFGDGSRINGYMPAKNINEVLDKQSRVISQN